MKPKRKNKNRNRWVLKSIIITFALSCAFGISSELLLKISPTFFAVLVVLCIIAIGVLFDIIGVALTAADKARFFAMDSKRVYASKQCVYMVKHADILSNVCNDIIGDICGIISGASGAVIALRLATGENANLWLGIIVSAVIAALTVGGKAYGKRVGMKKSNEIVLLVGKTLAFFTKK
ncbi:MAG: hypothetical protein IJR47_03910 [Clostridia bacterium]|nr:hypothetical protein [Clostridia bacterium]